MSDTFSEADPRRLDMLLDLPLDVTVELGRTRMSIQELLTLGPGSVIELDKVAGEPLDILINDRLVARGEAVVVNDKFGIRITDIVSPMERLTRLR
jgi:flagellar motor switch protein FliN/FliY